MIFDFLSESNSLRWLLGCLAAAIVAGAAYRLRALDLSGMTAATVLGTVLVGSSGWSSGLILIAFFTSSSILSRVGLDSTVVSTARGNRRDAVQVFANGGVALVCALAYMFTQHYVLLLAIAGSLAAASADTWSTEVGRTSPTLPRMVTTGRVVPAGTSGAVSGRGLAAAACGALFIGVLTGLGVTTGMFDIPRRWEVVLLAVSAGGFAGAVLDSLIGATLQEQRWCERCKKQTERYVHRCGTPTQRLTGVPWITNDVVNTACVLAGALVSAAMGILLCQM